MLGIQGDPIQEIGIDKYAEELRKGKVSAEEITSTYLERIEKLDSKYQSFTFVNNENALNSAKGIDKLIKANIDLGPLMGVPIAVKDLFAVDGMPSSAGSHVDVHDIIGKEGSFIKRLKSLGCIFLGKTRMIEFAAGGQNQNHVTPWNPIDADIKLTPGGSSNGSAVALGAGLCGFSIGTDTGGSVRAPASMCGLCGIKTSTGMWPLDGIFPLCPDMDTIGFFTHTMSDAKTVWSAIEDTALQTIPLKGLRVGMPTDLFFDDLEESVREATEHAVDSLKSYGIEIQEITLPDLDKVNEIYAKMVPSNLLATLGRKRFELKKDVIDPVAVDRILTAYEFKSDEYIQCLQTFTKMKREIKSVISNLDAFITPTCPIKPQKVAELDTKKKCIQFSGKSLRNTRPCNAYDLCATSIPIHKSGKKLPVGLQVHCDHGEDFKLLSISSAIENVFKKNIA